ncbi:glutamate--tRNA ligase-like [Athalia rosae]|uniref:glutamate--tRNA ligase-like n=1 Tax=Athalia rosae TaxID=37344 RepID=UPI002033AA92|nr:glutamate--tRNA ligase-like [Athalia rosae]
MHKVQRALLSSSNLETFPKWSYRTQGVHVRFAPSPTGYLHLGGLRTALCNIVQLFIGSRKPRKFYPTLRRHVSNRTRTRCCLRALDSP